MSEETGKRIEKNLKIMTALIAAILTVVLGAVTVMLIFQTKMIEDIKGDVLDCSIRLNRMSEQMAYITEADNMTAQGVNYMTATMKEMLSKIYGKLD